MQWVYFKGGIINYEQLVLINNIITNLGSYWSIGINATDDKFVLEIDENIKLKKGKMIYAPDKAHHRILFTKQVPNQVAKLPPKTPPKPSTKKPTKKTKPFDPLDDLGF